MNTSLSAVRVKTQRRNSLRAFTLIELLVVIAIVGVISTLILARNGQFNGQVLLRNLAYDIALSVRQAQVYAISGRAGSTNSGVPYGAYFQSTANTQYVIFADNNGNGAYDVGEETEVLTVRSGYSLVDICGDPPVGTADCSSNAQITSLTLLFKRPDPDAYIKTSKLASGYKQARIIARSPTGDTRVVTVTLTGQISIQQGIN